MHELQIDAGSCVRVYSKNSECSKCADVCPYSAITYQENIPIIGDACVNCGGCIGVCPTEAISLKSFDSLNFIFGFLEERETLINCKKNVPCLASLSVENLISMAILSDNPVELDLGHCQTCPHKDPLFAQIQSNIEEANIFLRHIESGKQLLDKEIGYVEPSADETAANRRDFLKRFSVKGAIKSKVEFEEVLQEEEKEAITQEDTANIRKKEIPNKRKLFFMAMKRIPKPHQFHTYMADEISFTSEKYINDACDNCSMCYRICPTGALQSDKRHTKIEFDPLLCVKCALCHDVCAPNAITLTPYSTRTIFEPKIEELKSFTIARCDECANYFTYLGGEKMCPRCKIEEEEAKTLWGIQ